MINFDRMKEKNKRKELIFRDFLDVRSGEQMRCIHQHNFLPNFPTTVNYDIQKLAPTFLGEGPTVNITSDS